FYAEVRRVLRPGGIIALWCYREPTVSPAIDAIIVKFQNEMLGPYWSPKIQYAMDGYRTLPFTFEEVPCAPLKARARWTLDLLLGHLGTWSARRTYAEARGTDPLDLIRPDLEAAWGEGTQPR